MSTTLGKVVLVTGGIAGLGAELLRQIVASGPPSKIILICRSEARGRRAAEAAKASHLVQLVHANLDSMAEVSAAAQQITAECAQIDFCFLNAACFASSGVMGQRVLTAEGLETMFACNHCAPYLLIRMLAPRTLAPRARVIITGSDAAEFLAWKLDRASVQGELGVGFGGFTQYSHTKLMNAMFGAELQARADDAERAGRGGGLDVAVCHPGAVMTELGNNVGPWLAWGIKTALAPLFRTPEMAMPLLLQPAISARPLRGYFADGNVGTPTDLQPKPYKGAALSSDECTWLWDETERLITEAIGGGSRGGLAAYGEGAAAAPARRQARSPQRRRVR